MPRIILTLGLFVLCQFAGNLSGLADNSGYADPKAATPAPAGPSTPSDVSDFKRYFTITADLREEYDDNINTAKVDKVGSFKTDLSPSILVDIPMDDSDFSARYSFGLIYYENRNGGSIDTDHEFVAQYRHSFSDRFGFNVADQFRYSSEPSLMDSYGTNFRNGAYYVNTVNLGFNAQWTPLLGTQTSYSNTLIRYEDATQSIEQDNDENTVSQSVSFAVLPKLSVVLGGIFDNISYDSISRGYTSYTGNTGLDWQALPSLTLGGRVGGTITDTDQSGSSTSPYAALTLSWQLGARSSLTFDYSHDVVPTDVYTAEGQVADRFTAHFKYDVNPKITTHLEGIFTHGDYTEELITPGTIGSFTEDVYAVDLGAEYHYDNHFDFEGGYILSGVSSGQTYREYTRNQVYLGVRGTY